MKSIKFYIKLYIITFLVLNIIFSIIFTGSWVDYPNPICDAGDYRSFFNAFIYSAPHSLYVSLGFTLIVLIIDIIKTKLLKFKGKENDK